MKKEQKSLDDLINELDLEVMRPMSEQEFTLAMILKKALSANIWDDREDVWSISLGGESLGKENER